MCSQSENQLAVYNIVSSLAPCSLHVNKPTRGSHRTSNKDRKTIVPIDTLETSYGAELGAYDANIKVNSCTPGIKINET